MAELLVFGLVVAGGVMLIGKMQENSISFGNDGASDVDIKKKTLDHQREWGYLPTMNQVPTSTKTWNRVIPRLKAGDTPAHPESVADVYASAFGQKVKELAADAFNQTDHSIVVPHGQTRQPLFIPLSAQGKGDMANYPFSYFEKTDNQDPIETKQDIFTDPLPSTFPGPARGIYPPAVAPDELRNPWAMDGRYGRTMNQYRRPAIATRPMKVSKRSSFYPTVTHPWARRVSDQAY